MGHYNKITGETLLSKFEIYVYASEAFVWRYTMSLSFQIIARLVLQYKDSLFSTLYPEH
jgi:hypothetical protein